MASINAPPMDFTNSSYTNLPSPTSIRLLSFIKRPRQLSPPSILGEPLVECIIETVNIDEAPDFDLISSTWGNPDSADPGDIDEYEPMHLYPVTIDGKLMFLPKNIYEALKMAQKVNDPVERRNELFLETELMTAVENNHRPKVQRLLEQGAHIHAQDCFGKTAIHHAAQLGHFDIINTLLDYGASMKVIDSYDKTPMDYITYTKPKDWESLEEIAYKMQKTPEERGLVPIPDVIRVGRPMWIDAICIDQSNPEERANHGSLMAQIYCRASSIIAWLGVQSDETKLAPETISSILRADGKDPDEAMSDGTPSTTNPGYSYIPTDEEKSSIIRFLRRSWFEREGLMHEVAFGRAITVYCGMDALPFSSIMEFLRREAYSGTFLPSDLQVWSLLGNTGSKKRRSLELRSRTKRIRRASIDG
ncbi:ankyrin het domain-containing protein [Fusarium phyllophilum]|uniref:Ankyrin het domain-containing protein n=1 Tax=Fusarium phyllophilum TaxID=47803 RepID=A0A8H5NJ15_9HYPO|nr:ankyrin het domain-containing protein [Fusarium phyllophilum]